jgi:PAS domain S-box-containing protein
LYFSTAFLILYTGQGSEEVAEEAFNVGIDDYVMKEIEIGHYRVLVNKIKKAVEKYKVIKINNSLLSSLPDSTVIIDKDYNIIYNNEAFNKYSKLDESIGNSILSYLDENSREDFLKWVKNHRSDRCEVVFIGYDNISYFVEINKIKYNEKNNENTLLLIKDITDYKVEQEIKDLGEERFLSLVEVIPDGIMAMNMMGYVTYINPAFCDITGFSEDEIIGSHMLRLKTMENTNIMQYWNILKSLIRNNQQGKAIDFTYNRKDGSTGLAVAYITLINFNGKREVLAILKDVTQKKMREEEFENIFRSSPDGIMHLEIDGKVKSVNDKALSIFELIDVDIVGKNILEFEYLFEDQGLSIYKLYEKVVDGKKIQPFEIQIELNRGPRYIEMTASLLTVNTEKLGILLVIRDVTREKEIEFERRKYTENLEELVDQRTRQIVDAEKMAAVGKMSSMIAHDLKGPLQVINNSLHLLKRNPQNSETYIEYISDSVQRCNEMLSELSTSIKQGPLEREKISIADIINDSVKQLNLIDKIQYETNINVNPLLYLDKSKIRRVFDNLLKNAIEAMPDGGKITINTNEKGNNINIEIVDTGVGIPEEKLDKIFKPFNTTKTKGMGLGLVFCKNTIESHGGEITILSEQNKGTKVMIKLPLENKLDNENYVSDSLRLNDTLTG